MTMARPARCRSSAGALLENPKAVRAGLRRCHGRGVLALRVRRLSGADRQNEGTREMTSQASTPDERGERAEQGTPIRIRVGDARLTARLEDQPNAPNPAP